MNYIMPCLITALTKSAVNKTTSEKKQNRQKKTFKAKVQHLNFVALSNNVKIQSDKTLTQF